LQQVKKNELFDCGVMEMKWILVREEEAGKAEQYNN